MTEEPRSAAELAGGGPVRGWRAAFPPAQWLATYRPQWLAQDAIAGFTLAAFGIPVSLAYASLAGLPPQYGIYLLSDTNLAVMAIGLAALAVLLLGEKLLPGLPVALFVVVISIVVLSVTPLADLGFNVVGALPQGLPDFHAPGLRVRDILRAEGLEERVGHFGRRGSVADVIDELQGGTGAGSPLL